ncbi:MAG: FtsX-like permease family protein [Treponemataceae bacterium]|nr:FtsX-like permease family protein [Treponemataceae bacterium]
MFSFALRNIWRNPRRSLLTMAGIMAGVTSILITGGYYEYNYWGLRESFIRSQYGHVQLAMKGYREQKEEEPFRFLLPSYEKLIDILRKHPEVEVVSPHLTFFGILETEKGVSELVMVRGVDPEAENRLNTFFTRKAGKDLGVKDLGMAELGFELARKTALNVGSTFWLTTITAEGTQNVLPLQVKGIIGSYSADFDAKILRIPLETAQILAGTQGVQELVILLKDTEKTKTFRQELEKSIKDLSESLVLSTWDEQAGYYAQVVQFYGGYFRLMVGIVMMVVFCSTLTTMIMSIFERMSEIGTIRSFGARRWFVLELFLKEGFLIGLIGTIAGLLLALFIAGLVRLAGGIPMAPPPGLTTKVGVQILFTPSTVGIAVLVGVAVPLCASLLPAYRMMYTEIIEQIRYKER